MSDLSAREVHGFITAYSAALTALFATHPQPALLREVFAKSCDLNLPAVESDPISYGIYQTATEQLASAIGVLK
jgi:hypothetical protein